jgi:hypothetical protein
MLGRQFCVETKKREDSTMMSMLKLRVLNLRRQWLEKWNAMLAEGEESKRLEDIALQKQG